MKRLGLTGEMSVKTSAVDGGSIEKNGNKPYGDTAEHTCFKHCRSLYLH